nr:NAD-dependent epimerase/dehydratase family protein [Pseudodesulfovibrio sp. S3-i]
MVLGHSGFIGQSLVANLRKQNPEVETVGYSAPDIDYEKKEDWEKIATQFGSDVAVIFLAAVKRQEGDNLASFQRNMSMIHNLAEAVETTPVGKLIYFSSGAVYGEDVQHPIMTEDTPVQPTSFYGICKFTAERILRKVCPEGTLVCFRPPTAYGGGDLPQYGPSGFVYKAIRNEAITLWGDGTEKREFIYIDDLVELTRRAVFDAFSGVLNICAGISYTFQNVLKEVEQLPSGLPEIDQRERTKDKVDNDYDNSLLRRVFPDFRFTPLSEGIKLTYEVMRKRI